MQGDNQNLLSLPYSENSLISSLSKVELDYNVLSPKVTGNVMLNQQFVSVFLSCR